MIPDPDLIAFCGDWHGNTSFAKDAIYAAARSGCQAVIHTGDFGFNFAKNYMHGLRVALRETGLHLYFVDGNHDNHQMLWNTWPVDEDGFHAPRFADPLEENRIHYIPRGHRWTWWGKTFMGLGGAVSVDRHWRTAGVDWWPEEMITTGDVYRAIKGGKVDVMITHDIPAKAQLPNDRKSIGNPQWPHDALVSSEQNRQMLQTVVDEVQPSLLVHGHFHIRDEQQVGQLHIVSLDKDFGNLKDNLYIVDSDLEPRLLIDREPVSDKLAEIRKRSLMDNIEALNKE